MKQHLLLLTTIFPPAIGGPATYIDRLAAELSNRGWVATVLCATPAPKGDDTKRCFRVIRPVGGNRVIREALLRIRLIYELLRHRAVLVNGLQDRLRWAARLIRFRYVLKVVGDTAWEAARNSGGCSLSFDAFQADAAARRPWAAIVEEQYWIAHMASQVVVPSEYLRRVVRGWGIPADRISVVLNGVDLPEAPPCTPPGSKHRAPGAPFKVLFVGRLTNWKGVETILLAVAKLGGVTATIVGDGPELPRS